jgi:hypothetical protein
MKNIRLKLLVFAALSVVGSALYAVPASADVPGVLKGTMKISPLCPVQTYPGNAGNPSCGFNAYQQYRLFLKQGDEVVQDLHVHPNGKFVGVVQPGTYVIDISPNYWNRPCPIGAPCAVYPGSANVPAQVIIKAGKITSFDVVIDTGIR